MIVKALVSYDGFNYAGWQKQENALGIQQVIEEALYKITKGQFEAPVLANRADTDTTAIADETTALGTDIKVTTKNVLTTATVNTTKKTDTLLSNVSIASNAAGDVTDYYALKVEYRSVDANQNIENEAALTLKVTIS